MNKLTILYDGKCSLCEKTINFFLHQDETNALIGLDYNVPDFDPSTYLLKKSEIDLYMHSIDSNGKIYKGIDTFIEIFKRIPKFKWPARILKIFFIKIFFKIIYHILAVYIRPYLPKKACKTGHCN